MPGMPWTFPQQPRVSNPDMHHATCVTHVLWCMPGSLTSIFLWSRWRGKRSRHSQRMRNPQCCVSGKRPVCITCFSVRFRSRGLCNIGYPPETHPKLKFREISSVHNIRFSYSLWTLILPWSVQTLKLFRSDFLSYTSHLLGLFEICTWLSYE